MIIYTDYTSNSINTGSIPKRVILTYKTKNINEFPPFYKKCLDQIIEYFHDYEIKIFDDNDLDNILKNFDRKLYNIYATKRIVEKTDIFRLVALYTYGGIYLDLDVLLEKNPREYILKSKKEVILCQEKKIHQQPFEIFINKFPNYMQLANYFMASVPNSHFIYKCLYYILILNSNTKETIFDDPYDESSKIILYTGTYGNSLVESRKIVIAVNYVSVDKNMLNTQFAKTLCTTGPCLITKVFYDNVEFHDTIDILTSDIDDTVGIYGKHHSLNYCY